MLTKGDKVCYIPFKDAPKEKWENGIVKENPDDNSNTVFVVFRSNNDWEDYENYTGAKTPITKLKTGWKN